jgi:Uma2 family endonuclease
MGYNHPMQEQPSDEPLSFPATDQRVVLHDIPWPQYLALRRLDDRPGLRMTYLEGTLELMSPSERHEDIKTRIARLLEVWAMETETELSGFGSTTFRSRARKGGLEPDECYRLASSRKGRPDIAIELQLTSGGVEKLEVYRRLGVPEVWIWSAGSLSVHRLGSRGYSIHQRSAVLPDLDVALLASFVASAATQTRAAITYRDVLRARRSAP